VLFNLIGNGVKFTERGQVVVRVERLPADGAFPLVLRFEVADTGIGLPEDKQEQVFDAFFQMDSSIARRYGGTGLGLAICKKLIDALGGRIGVDSVLGQGSRFWFTLGFEPGDARALVASEDTMLVAPPRRLGTRSVLLVEDNEVSRLVASSFLEAMGHKVTVVADGRQAIEAVEESDFDVVLMDISMPRMSGIEATRRIRALADEKKSRVPIIAMSAHVFRSEIDEHLQSGMNAFVGKPISPERLERVLAEVLLGEADAGETLPEAEAGRRADLPWVAREALVADMQILGPERMQHLVELFLKATPDRVHALGKAVETMDLEAVAFAAHGLKSSATSLGLLRLAGRLEALETAAEAGQSRRVSELHRDVDRNYRKSTRILVDTWQELAGSRSGTVTPGRRRTDSLLHAR
jgi:two-component system sensor histidine kinase TorS